MRRFFVWFAALVVVVAGCGGRSMDGNAVEPDSGEWRDADAGRPDGAMPNDGVVPDDDGRPPFDAARDGNEHLDGARDAPSSDGNGGRLDDARDTSDARPTPGDAVDERTADLDVRLDQASDGAADAAGAPDAPSVRDGRYDVLSDGTAEDAPKDGTADECSAVTCGLVSLSVLPISAAIAQHGTVRLQATAVYADSSMRDVTTQVTWSSSAGAVAHVSRASGTEGLVTGRFSGESTISAVLGAASASARIDVLTADPALLRLSPPGATLAVGTQQRLQLMVIFSDLATRRDWTSNAMWISDASSIASVTDGIVTAVAPGEATVTATVGWLTATAKFVVTAATLTSLTVDPPTPALPIGPVRPLRALGRFSDGSTQDLTEQAAWGSADVAIATVGDAPGSKGKVTGSTAGSTTITASFAGTTATAAVDIGMATLERLGFFYPDAGRIMLFMDVPMAVSGVYSNGTSFSLTEQAVLVPSGPIEVDTVARVVTGVEEGDGYVDVYVGNLTQRILLHVRAGELESIAVTPNPISIAEGNPVYVTAVGTYVGGWTHELTQFVPWITADTSVAWLRESVDTWPPILTGFKAGTTELTAFWGKSGSGVVEVRAMTPGSRR